MACTICNSNNPLLNHFKEFFGGHLRGIAKEHNVRLGLAAVSSSLRKEDSKSLPPPLPDEILIIISKLANSLKYTTELADKAEELTAADSASKQWTGRVKPLANECDAAAAITKC